MTRRTMIRRALLQSVGEVKARRVMTRRASSVQLRLEESHRRSVVLRRDGPGIFRAQWMNIVDVLRRCLLDLDETWLEELVSQSNTIQVQEDMARRTCFTEQYYTGTRRYCCAGKIAGKIGVKLCVIFTLFFLDISSIISSFGPASRLPQGIVSLHPWNAAGPQGKLL